MRTFLSLLLLLVCVGLVGLAATNPQMHDFETFVAAESERVIQEKIGSRSALGQALSQGGSSIVVSYVERFGERKNYILCSVYTLDRDGARSEGTDWRFLGIAGRFIPLEEPAEPQRAPRW